MERNKIIYGGVTLIDLTDATATASDIASGKTAYGADGALIIGTASGAGVGAVYQDQDGYVVLDDGAPYTQSKTITENGTHNVAGYGTAIVNVQGSGSPNLQSKTNIAPTESSQTITPDTGYDGLSSVQINAVSSTYVGSGIDRRSSSDLTASGATVSVPAGYYANQASKSVSSGTAGSPSVTKGTVSNHSISLTPSVTNVTGYITGGTKTGTAVTVSASELVSGSQTITENGTTDVTNLSSVTVSIPFVTYYTGTSEPSSSLGSDGDIYLKVVN